MLVLSIIGLPLAASVLALIFEKRRSVVCWLGVGVLIAQAHLVTMVPTQMPFPRVGLTLGMSGLSITLLLTVYFCLAVQFIYTAQTHQDSRFYALALIIDASITLSMLLHRHLVLASLLLVGTLTVAVYGIKAISSDSQGVNAALRMLIAAAVAAVAFLLSVLLIDTYNLTHDPGSIGIVAAALSIGFGTLLAVFPFHLWLPRLSEFAPPMVSVWLTAYLALAAVTLLISSADVYPWLHSSERVEELLRWAGVGIAIVMAYLALGSTQLGRVIVYSGASNLGVVVVGLACASVDGLVGAGFLVLTHTLIVLLLFMCLGLTPIGYGSMPGSIISTDRGILTIGLLVGGLGMSGCPPFGGFVGRWLIYQAAVAHDALLFVGMGLASLMVLLSFLRYLRTSPAIEASTDIRPLWLSVFSMTAVALALVVLGIYPAPVLSLIGDSIVCFQGMG